MIVKLLTEHHLEFLSLKGGCKGSSECTHVKIPHCWKSHALAHMTLLVQDSEMNWWLILYGNDLRETSSYNNMDTKPVSHNK